MILQKIRLPKYEISFMVNVMKTAVSQANNKKEIAQEKNNECED